MPAAPSFEPPLLDAVPVKSLGPPPFWSEPRPFAVVMETLYRAICSHVRALALAEDTEDDAE
jgi:hypothetical protein